MDSFPLQSHQNQTLISIMEEFVGYPNGILASVSILPNAFVLLTFIRGRRSTLTLNQGTIQLFILGISDLLYNILISAGFVWLLCARLQVCQMQRVPVAVFALLLCLVWFPNRHLTAYIAYKRAMSLLCFPNALHALSASESRHVMDTVFFGVVPMVTASAILGSVRALLITRWLPLPPHVELLYYCITAACGFSWVIAVLGCTVYILVKTNRIKNARYSGVSRTSGVARMNETQKMVVMVAVLFVVCEIPLVVRLVWRVVGFVEKGDIQQPPPQLGSVLNFAEMMFSSVNLFVYLAISKNFRNSFVLLFKCT